MRDGTIAYLAFTERGRALAQRLCADLGGEVSCTRDGVTLEEWTSRWFTNVSALVYIGAAGIAVRAVAPHLVSKASDPAVVCLDEGGRFAIPLLSGHLGGANELARRIARVCGAACVITTATDVRGVFAVDEWARVQGMRVVDPRGIKTVSAKLLAGESVVVCSAFPMDGEPPEGVFLRDSGAADVWVDVRPHAGLVLAPRALTLGVGCKRGVTRETLEERFAALCQSAGILPEAVGCAATIDRKRDEPGLLDFCAAHTWPLKTYSAGELAAAEGAFTSSSFVSETVGVDNVCERAAVCAAGGTLLVGKFAGDGVTLALAQRDCRLDWRWSRG